MKKFFYLALLFILTQSFAIGQNLMINGSFEDFSICPLYGNAWYYAPSKITGWTIVTNHTGSPDPFNSCDWQQSGNFPTDNYFGSEAPCEGNSYVGLYLTNVETTPLSWREYIVGSFTSPLQAGVTYNLSFCVSLADDSKYGSNNVEWLFSTTIPEVDVSVYTSSSQQHRFLNTYGYTASGGYYGAPITQKNGWTTITGQYTAVGGEMYITLGNFRNTNNTSTTLLSGSNSNPNSYIYIDDVQLVPITPLNVNLSTLLVNCTDENTELIWTVESESNNDFYTIDYSSNGIDWDGQTTIQGAGNTSSHKLYSHKFPAQCIRNHKYVRLSQTDFNGTTTQLGIRTIDCTTNETSIYPNPMNESIQLNATDDGSIEIYDSWGKLVLSRQIHRGKQVLFVDHLSTGFYLARVHYQNGSDQVIKLMKEN